MKHQYKRNRSDFFVTIYENEDNSFNISTRKKYTELIENFFPIMCMFSYNGWKESKNHEGVYNLWFPNGNYVKEYIEELKRWCEEASNDVLWLKKNKNIEDFFEDELDYCIAMDFNFEPGDGRTPLGEAEYQLKYRADELDDEEIQEYMDFILDELNHGLEYIPITDDTNWGISVMPATEEGKDKLAWHLGYALAQERNLDFVDATLTTQKPQMKQISVSEKIHEWEKIYNSGNVLLNGDIMNKNIVIVDDLYQSGVTMWQYARYLKSKGANQVWGLVCVKSLRDSDNT